MTFLFPFFPYTAILLFGVPVFYVMCFPVMCFKSHAIPVSFLSIYGNRAFLCSCFMVSYAGLLGAIALW